MRFERKMRRQREKWKGRTVYDESCVAEQTARRRRRENVRKRKEKAHAYRSICVCVRECETLFCSVYVFV